MTTGSTEDVKKKNLYDIAGNLWEWTQETVSINTIYMVRGGSFSGTGAGRLACGRKSYTSSTVMDNGFRVVLYIK